MKRRRNEGGTMQHARRQRLVQGIEEANIRNGSKPSGRRNNRASRG